MEIFQIFYSATTGVILGIISISIPMIILIKIYVNFRDYYTRGNSDMMIINEDPNILEELFVELKEYLEEEEDYENLQKVNMDYINFCKRKTSMEDVFKIYTVESYWIDQGDKPKSRTGILLDEFSDVDEKDPYVSYCYGTLHFKKPMKLKDFIKKIIF